MSNSTITIGGSTKDLKDADSAWVASQVNGRHGAAVCVQVRIKTDRADITLSSGACPASGGGGGRAPNANENDLFDLWNRKHLNAATFTIGELVSFVNEVQRSL